MNNRESGPVPSAGDVWPPAPLHDEPTPLFFFVEGMQLTRSGDRLVVLNTRMRGLFFVELCVLAAPALSPWIDYWTSPLHHAALPGWLPYVISIYRHSYALYLFILFIMVGAWFLFTLLGNLGGVTLDRQQETVKMGGRGPRPMSGMEAVLIKRTHNTLSRTQYVVQLTWSDGEPIKTYFLGSLRQEANAEKVAAMVTEFADVPVRHQPKRKNSV